MQSLQQAIYIHKSYSLHCWSSAQFLCSRIADSCSRFFPDDSRSMRYDFQTRIQICRTVLHGAASAYTNLAVHTIAASVLEKSFLRRIYPFKTPEVRKRTGASERTLGQVRSEGDASEGLHSS